jgi:hypothetical protein
MTLYSSYYNTHREGEKLDTGVASFGLGDMIMRLSMVRMTGCFITECDGSYWCKYVPASRSIVFPASSITSPRRYVYVQSLHLEEFVQEIRNMQS